MRPNKKHEFWVTNIHQKKDISLGDLRLTIRKGETRNLLDARHYTYTLEQLENSADSGSIYAKSRWIKIRNLPPRYPVQPGRYTLSQKGRWSVARPHKDIEAPKFEELDFDDAEKHLKEVEEKFAADDADIVHNDNAPALVVDKTKYNKGG